MKRSQQDQKIFSRKKAAYQTSCWDQSKNVFKMCFNWAINLLNPGLFNFGVSTATDREIFLVGFRYNEALNELVCQSFHAAILSSQSG